MPKQYSKLLAELYGEDTKVTRRTSPTQKNEHDEHLAVMDWVRLHHNIDDHLIHIANQRQCSPQYGKKLQKMGVKKGVSDFFLAMPSNDNLYHGLWIELKVNEKSHIDEDQKVWIERMRAQGYAAHFAFGADHAIKIITDYLHAKIKDDTECS